MKSEICKLEERKIQKEKRYKNIMMSFVLNSITTRWVSFLFYFFKAVSVKNDCFALYCYLIYLLASFFPPPPSPLSQFCQLSSRSVYFVDLFFCVCVCLHFFFYFLLFLDIVSSFFFPPSLFLKLFFFLLLFRCLLVLSLSVLLVFCAIACLFILPSVLHTILFFVAPSLFFRCFSFFFLSFTFPSSFALLLQANA